MKIVILILFIIMFFLIYKCFCNIEIKENYENFIPHYVFWTGGYDSTFRICELLIINQVPVQPVYLAYNLDSASSDDFWVRKNRLQEKEAMDKIRTILNIRFPYTKNLLYDTLYIDKNIEYKDYDYAFLEMNLWPKKRKIHQYSHLGKVSYMMKTYIDSGVLGIHKQSNLVNFLDQNLEKIGNTYRLNVDRDHPLHFLQFPLINKTKKDLCDISKQYNFNDIIKLSWSCWFPNGGKPCKKCPMCIERFDCS